MKASRSLLAACAVFLSFQICAPRCPHLSFVSPFSLLLHLDERLYQIQKGLVACNWSFLVSFSAAVELAERASGSCLTRRADGKPSSEV
jgi:hypothetical protein